jgi:CheY-like chemotaxis protein
VEELGLALGELRELARGLHPAILTSGGLGVALRSLAGRAPVPVTVTGVPSDRLPDTVEAAAYYVVAEALTNVAKYAGASAARVRLELQETTVVIEVADDGVGGADVDAGTGLRGLADRVEALGGRLDLDSPAGGGTILRAAIPCRSAPEAALDARQRSTAGAARDVFAAVKGRVVERSGGEEIPLRVVVAEDALLLRAGVVRVLEDASFEVVGQAGDAEGLIREVRARRPDVAVTDIRMPPTYTDEGLQAARLIRAELPATGVLLLSQYAEETYALELLGDGPAGVGYLLKDRISEPQAFVDAVRQVGRGGSVIDPEVVAAIGGRPADAPA